MAELTVTFLDVGWGDSILLEARDSRGRFYFGLVDSNDTTNWPTTRVFLKRYFERHAKAAGPIARSYPFFDVVIASHSHTDHVVGLQGVIRQFGTDAIYMPRFNASNSATTANLLRWTKRATRKHVPVAKSQHYLDKSKTFSLGPVDISVIWPPPPLGGLPNAPHDPSDENNNSLVLVLRLDDVRIVLTGDCKADNWTKHTHGASWPIPLPSGLKLVQVPHHGARNGLFDSSGGTPLFDQISDLSRSDSTVEPMIAVSCHPEPHGHPHQDVSDALDALSISKPFSSCVAGTRWLRTDRSLHFSVWTDGWQVATRARPPY
jgi:beta-lactamase superfamily II metal-dependent hydrolase